MERNREIVDKLIKSIDDKFQEKAYKGHWYDLETNELCKLLAAEIIELINAIYDLDFDNAIREAADVALYAAFIADPVRVLKKNA